MIIISNVIPFLDSGKDKLGDHGESEEVEGLYLTLAVPFSHGCHLLSPSAISDIRSGQEGDYHLVVILSERHGGGWEVNRG